MKTTMDISDHLLLKAKTQAKRENVSLKSIFEEGLRLAIEIHEKKRKRSVKPVTFKGKGLSREFRGADWSTLREACYGERGK